MDWKIFGVLLWKHWCVRKRRIIFTILEYLTPIVMFLLLFLLKYQFLDVSPKASATSTSYLDIQRPEALRLRETSSPQCVFFTPNTEFTRHLMELVGKKLGLKSHKHLPDEFPGPGDFLWGYYPFNHTYEISNFTKSPEMRDNDAVVVFKNDESAVPDNLEYTIRMKRHFMTQLDTSMDGELVPHQNFGTIYEPFMQLQWAIDTAYLELLTGKEVKQDVVLQEFPFAHRATASAVELAVGLVSACAFFSLVLMFTLLVARLVGERTNGVQELMKMSGVSSATLGVVHFLDTLPALFSFSISGAVFLTIGPPALLENTNGFLLFLCLFLHSCTIVAFGFVCGYLVRSMEYTNTLAATLFIALAILSDSIQSHVPGALQPALGLVPTLPLRWILRQVAMLGRYGSGLSFHTMAHVYSPAAPSALVGMIFMAVQTVFYMLLAWYLDHVLPGKLGLALPWNFLFQKQYWRKNDIVPEIDVDEQEVSMTSREEQYFEPVPSNVEVGIKAVNITKVFPKHVALKNVSLDVYKGELTILLGHNGAGKTTLMSIMTGTLNPTLGTVYVNGHDIASHPDTRKQIGFCPQHNVFFPQLSVIEHVVLFSMLRGQSRSEAWKTSQLLLDRLGIESKARSLSAALSGGMKRRLQMACALAGDASVIVLDEPSSGLDVETRRGLWDLVLGLRGKRTVLISTHFMEEADALGDRVAALHLGVLRCHASPMYLKKAIGTGYRLTFTTLGQPNETAIGNVVMSAIPDATVKEVTINSISYALPAASSGAFPAMFSSLEAKRRELGIESIGVGVSTLEEVFLRLCSDIDTSSLTQDEVDGVSREEPQYTMTTGPYLYLLQFYELIKRQMSYIWYKKYSFAIWQVLVPVLVVCLMGSLFSNERAGPGAAGAARRLHLAMYEPPKDYRVLYHADKQTEDDIRAIGEQYPQVKFERVHDVADVVLKAGLDDVMEYHKYLAGIELNETNAKVLFTTTLRHAAPAALSLLANVLARRAAAAPPRLAVLCDPLDADRPDAPSVVFNAPKMDFFLYMFTFFVGSVMLFNMINAAHLPILERISGARHLHIMAGCPPELHWLSTLVFRALVIVVTFIVPVVIVCACDSDDTIDEPVFMMAWFMVMLLSTLAFLPFIFLITFFFNHTGTNAVLSLCVFGNMVMYLAGYTGTWSGALHALVLVSQHVFPAHAALAGLVAAARRALTNAQCTLNRHLCAAVPLPGCCDSEYKNVACMFCYGESDNPAPGYSMAVLLAQSIVYTSLVFAMQRGLVTKLYEKAKTATYTPPEKRFQDEMVRAERTYVSRAIGLPTPQISDVMLVSDLHKVHSSLWKKFVAIRGVSFSVKKGECLGLLGVNGAGKSSAFRVLTAEDWATRGQVFANGQHRDGFSSKYMHGLGYCPQFFGLDEFLTGRQNLRLLLTLRGLDRRDAATETASWIKIVGLEKYTDRRVVGYSGGCQRRLAAAASLSVGAALTLLDEPTAGVDVSARRRVWAALRRGLAHGRALIITSHSMDEMEALCHRIAIMSGGELCALGTPAALRAAHAAGHAVVIKVRPQPSALPTPADDAGKRTLWDETDSAANVLNRLKGTLVETFDCTLKDEHRTMLHYHINQTMQYSQIFEEMERLKSTFPGFVEDYSVTETTLEEVFLSFARRAERLEAAEPTGRGARRDPEVNPRPV